MTVGGAALSTASLAFALGASCAAAADLTLPSGVRAQIHPLTPLIAPGEPPAASSAPMFLVMDADRLMAGVAYGAAQGPPDADVMAACRMALDMAGAGHVRVLFQLTPASARPGFGGRRRIGPALCDAGMNAATR